MAGLGEKLRQHKRNRHLVWAGGMLLIFAGWYLNRPEIVISGLALVNLYGLIIMSIDKKAAKNGRFRIPEASLLTTAALGGAAGILLGMGLFHHKTKHWQFLLTVPLCFVVELCLIVKAYL